MVICYVLIWKCSKVKAGKDLPRAVVGEGSDVARGSARKDRPKDVR